MQKKIWIVDDDSGILEVIELILHEEGYATKVILNGNSLHKELVKEKPHLILLDILMSGIDGRDIAKTLKKNPATKNIPIIIMSADIHVDQKAQEADANAFIRKPFDIEHLVKLVRTFAK